MQGFADMNGVMADTATSAVSEAVHCFCEVLAFFKVQILFSGMPPRYMNFYQGGGVYEQYGNPYGPMDDYYVNYGGGGFDDYYGYEDYDYYSQMPFGARGRGRGNVLVS
jgi:hypothetical protein